MNHAFSNNLIAGLEVLYDDYGSKGYEWVEIPHACSDCGGEQSVAHSVDLDAFTVRGTLTYHFN